MPMQKVVFLYCSPAGEEKLKTLLKERADSLAASDSDREFTFFSRSVHDGLAGHCFRIWFRVRYPDPSPGTAALEQFVHSTPEKEFFFARFGETPEDCEEKGFYERMELPEKE